MNRTFQLSKAQRVSDNKYGSPSSRTMNTDNRILSIAAFALFISGVVSPFFPRVFGSDDVAVIFGIIATVLALILGLLGRSFLLGKVAAIGALIVCVIGTINYIRFRSDSGAAELRMRPPHTDRQ
jgi:hypothetical protein